VVRPQRLGHAAFMEVALSQDHLGTDRLEGLVDWRPAVFQGPHNETSKAISSALHPRLLCRPVPDQKLHQFLSSMPTAQRYGLLAMTESVCSERLYQINTWQVRLFEANIFIVLEVVG
jgi:hypothetical protein